MHEIFYVDIYLVLNFIMNFFLLILTAIIRQKKGTGGRIFLLSIFFAVISTGSTYMLWNEKAARAVSAIIEMAAMVYAAYLPGSVKNWCRDMGIFFSLTLFLGGGITACFSAGTALFGNLPVPSAAMFFLSLLLMGIAFFQLRRQWVLQRQNQQTIVWVEMFHAEKTVCGKALIDTGNRLVSPYTGEGVWIVSQELSQRLELSKGSSPLLIPFQSLGGDGLWEAYRLDRALVDGKNLYENVLVAVSPHLGEMDEIQIILNIIRS